MKRRTSTCHDCGSEVSLSNMKRHVGSKQCKLGHKFSDRTNYDTCPYCNIDLPEKSKRANHVKWCNPASKQSNFDHLKTARSAIIDDNRKASGEKISELHKAGHYDQAYLKLKGISRIQSEETKEKIRKGALASGHQRRMRRTHEFTDKRGRTFMFDSSWEDALAIRLDELDINWTRPEPVAWVDSKGKTRNYFADFYLLDHDLYLDPKNTYCREQQAEKIQAVSQLINLVIIENLEACKDFEV